MPFPLKPLGSSLALGILLGLTPEEAEGAPYGVKRFKKLWHGVAGGPKEAAENYQNILGEGFLKGQSAELNLPGTSVSEDPWVSWRLFTGVNAKAQPGSPTGPNKAMMLAVDPQIEPSQVRNLSPAQYLTGIHPDKPELYGKPNLFWREDERFALRSLENVTEYDYKQLSENPEVKQYWDMMDEVYADPSADPMTKWPAIQAYKEAHPNWDYERLTDIQADVKHGLLDPSEIKYVHSTPGEQQLIKPRIPTAAEKNIINRMIDLDDRYAMSVKEVSAARRNMKFYKGPEGKLTYRNEYNNYVQRVALKDWIGMLNSLRGNSSLLEQRLGKELFNKEKGKYGTEKPSSVITGTYQEDIVAAMKDALPAKDYDRLSVKFRDAAETRRKLMKYASPDFEQNILLHEQMGSDLAVSNIADKKLSQLYSSYYKKRNDWLDDAYKTIGGMSTPKTKAKLPAVAAGEVAGNIGEAKPTTGIQQFFQTNPVGQFMTGIARSVPETAESMINEAQSMGSQFYGLPEQQSGTKFTNYLTEQGIIPPKTGSAWETLGGLLGL